VRCSVSHHPGPLAPGPFGLGRVSFLLDRLEIPDERRDLRSGSFLDFGRRLVRLRYLSVPVAPDWHFSLTMSSNNATPINDVGYFIGWEFTPIRFCDLRQIGRSSLEGFGQSPITMPVDAVAGHARKFIFDNSKMGVFGFRFPPRNNPVLNRDLNEARRRAST
jgi:hypothetical protein